MSRPRPINATTILALSLVLLAVNFWSWSLLSPLAGHYAAQLSLSPLHVAILLAMPIIMGSLGRIPVGILVDRYGGRVLFSAITAMAALATLALLLADSYALLMTVAILLGIAGTSFAVGVPLINGWFSPSTRGLALGIYSIGNAGTAISGFLTPTLVSHWGNPATFLLIATALGILSVLSLLVLKNPPGWTPSREGGVAQLRAALRLGHVWDLSLIYAITFGAFVTFAMYLPVLLTTLYELEPADAAARAGGFIVLATLSRPVGGWLSDRLGGQRIILGCLAAIAALAVVIAFQPILTHLTTIAFLALAAVLGCGSGAVIALTGSRTKPEQLGAAVGIVGAIGGLGGFLPPMVLGASYQLAQSYTVAILLLGFAAMAVLGISAWRFRSYAPLD
jgi:NNP family nitrate/nitrite transporter-like MFS transporter